VEEPEEAGVSNMILVDNPRVLSYQI
jgi:hypothetical protein